ncbi:domain-containing [Fusarium albosuccineum]|uniref:Domain-containing n=1 Tax=Fusarium albosuccineum TaxID=1237068 RepID=A0A8H4L250_9HYPO|nr:domain-containing [Fusarium albosuccineum]
MMGVTQLIAAAIFFGGQLSGVAAANNVNPNCELLASRGGFTTCRSLAENNGISLETLVYLNPSLARASNCDQALNLYAFYCVKERNPDPAVPIQTPEPHTPNMFPNCNTFAPGQHRLSCWDMAGILGVSMAQWDLWNPSMASTNWIECYRGTKPEVYYCVGAKAGAPSPPGSSSTKKPVPSSTTKSRSSTTKRPPRSTKHKL